MGKTVLCNCDDPFESNFFKYFAMNFNHLGLKKLICTSYAGSPISQTEFNDLPLFHKNEKVPYMIEIDELKDYNGDGAENMDDVEYVLKNGNNVLTLLDGDGDFRSEECIGFLKEADVVVTNPPFSLFREYIAQLIKYNKKFIILSNMNAITYKEVFPLIKDERIWLGYGFNMSMVYKTPYPNLLESNRKFVISKGYNPDEGYVKVPAICWFTNLDIDKRHEKLITYKEYSANFYPKYDNYDAINVDMVSEIPCDYEGVMGVPITFLSKYNPDQFEIVGCDGQGDYPATKNYKSKEKVVDGKRMKSQTGTLGCVIREENFGNGTYFDVGYPVKAVYKRIFIKRRKHEN